MRRSHTISAIKTKQPIVLNLLVNGEGIHTRVRERGENSPFEKEIGAQKYRRLCRPNDIFINLALGNSIDRKQSIGCKANSTHTRVSTLHDDSRCGKKGRNTLPPAFFIICPVEGVVDQPFTTVLYFFGRRGRETVVIFQIFSLHLEVRIVSPSLSLPLSRFAPSFTLPIYAAVAPYPAPPPSSISHQPAIREGEPALLYLLLRYRPSSKSRRHACNTRNTRTLAHSRGREKERIRPFERGGGVRSPPKASLSLSFERGITTIDANSSLCSRHFCSRGGGE